MTSIEWTEKTWNPVVGCSVVSPGCTICYAMKMAVRLANNPRTPQYHGTIQPSKKGPVWTGKVGFSESVLLQPFKRKKPTTYFVNSMGDLFHPNVPDEWIDWVFAVMALNPRHTFQILTKQAERMKSYVNRMYARKSVECLFSYQSWGKKGYSKSPHQISIAKVLPNVWLGVSAEDQTRADERIPHLLNTPAAIHFVSAEPLLGAIDPTIVKHHDDGDIETKNWLTKAWTMQVEGGMYHAGRVTTGIDWVIVGGESGHKARPMHPDWARGIKDQCEAAGVKFLFKQWGEWQPISEIDDNKIEALHHPTPVSRPDASQRCKYDSICLDLDGTTYSLGTAGKLVCCPARAFAGPKPMSMFRVGKKAAGRLLDGREWNDMPEVG